MNVSWDLLDSICISFEDIEWLQTLDYEHVPFWCHKFHNHGHLFMDCPLNKPTPSNKYKEGVDQDGFRKSQARERWVGKHTKSRITVV
jgi:hypothetical protein